MSFSFHILLHIVCSLPEAYSELSWTSKMELILKRINSFQSLTIFAVISILDVHWVLYTLPSFLIIIKCYAKESKWRKRKDYTMEAWIAIKTKLSTSKSSLLLNKSCSGTEVGKVRRRCLGCFDCTRANMIAFEFNVIDGPQILKFIEI